jgi:hypothetical protein
MYKIQQEPETEKYNGGKSKVEQQSIFARKKTKKQKSKTKPTLN